MVVRTASKWTTPGKLGAITALSIGASAYPELRISVGGFEAHLVLIFVLLSFPLAFKAMQNKQLQTLVVTSLMFYLLFFLSLLPGEVHIVSNAIKTGAFFLTIMVSIGFVQTEKDYQQILLATSLAGVAICARGLIGFEDTYHGVNPLEGISNKNAFSVFILPPMLLGAYNLVFYRSTFWRNALVAGSILVMAVTTFSSGNRSGWLGVIMIAGLYMFWSKAKISQIIVVGLGAVAVYYFTGQLGARDAVVMHRIEQTTGGYRSDDLRFEILRACLIVGLRNPLLGVSPGRLSQSISPYLPVWTEGHLYGPHNLLAFLVAGSGILITLLFFFWLYVIVRASMAKRDGLTSLGPMLALLFFVRGMFTEEVLYNPMFGLCFGIVMGRAMLMSQWPQQILRKRSNWIPAILNRDGQIKVIS